MVIQLIKNILHLSPLNIFIKYYLIFDKPKMETDTDSERIVTLTKYESAVEIKIQ
jgi:hypothetical protein